MHRECASSWFKWLFRVSPIFVCESSCDQDWLTAFCPCVVVHATMGAAFLLLSFFNHIVLDSILCLFPISILVLRNSIVFIFCGVISQGFPLRWSLPALLSDPLFRIWS